MATRGWTSDKIDRELLHEWLWTKRDRLGFIPYSQTELAEMLGITIYTLSSIFGELRDQGRVEKHRSKYKVFDPKVVAWREHGPTLFDTQEDR